MQDLKSTTETPPENTPSARLAPRRKPAQMRALQTVDLVLEAAVNGGCSAIVTWNVRDFQLAASLGLQVLTPQQFLDPLTPPSPDEEPSP
mgnify:CR=1 FL=1